MKQVFLLSTEGQMSNHNGVRLMLDGCSVRCCPDRRQLLVPGGDRREGYRALYSLDQKLEKAAALLQGTLEAAPEARQLS